VPAQVGCRHTLEWNSTENGSERVCGDSGNEGVVGYEQLFECLI